VRIPKPIYIRRPLLVIAGCLALFAGAGLAYTWQLSDFRWVWGAVACGVFGLRKQSVYSLLCMVVLCFSFGWWRGSHMMLAMAPYRTYARQQVMLIGTATEDAVYGKGSQLTFGLDHIRLLSPVHQELPAQVMAGGFGVTAVFRGDRIQIAGKLYPTRGNSVATISYGELRVVSRGTSPIDAFRRKFGAGLQSALPEPGASFGLGILIGQRSTLPADIAATLTAVGLTHIIAVSGYNLTIIVEAVRRLLGGRSKYQMVTVCVLLVGVFLLITGNAPSIVRASIISMLSITAWYFGRTIKPLVLLLTAGAITVAVNPVYIWGNVSWYLSFLAFFGVVVLAPKVFDRIYKGRQPPLVPQVLLESLCAEIMTLPYVLYIFGQMSHVSLLANLLVAVVVPIAMLLCTVAGAAGMLVPYIAGWFSWPARWILTYMLDMSQLLARIPNAFVSGIGFSFWHMLACYGITGILLALMHYKNREKHGILTDENSSKLAERKTPMSGHSKWSTIKREKGAKDAARGAVFTKIGAAIALAARSGTDPNTNFSLRLAIDKAKAANMPLANIERAIQRVADKNAAQLQEITYEGYGPGGVAILVEVATDNINRTYPEVRLAFSKHGGNIAEKGAVAFQFDRKGMVRVAGSGDDLMLQALDAGAEDVQEDGDTSVIYTEPTQLAKVRDALRGQGVEVKEAELTYVPNTTVEITAKDTAGKIMRLMDALEDIDDVTNTHVNFDIAEEAL